MANLNKVMLIGRLTRDVEVRARQRVDARRGRVVIDVTHEERDVGRRRLRELVLATDLVVHRDLRVQVRVALQGLLHQAV